MMNKLKTALIILVSILFFNTHYAQSYWIPNANFGEGGVYEIDLFEGNSQINLVDVFETENGIFLFLNVKDTITDNRDIVIRKISASGERVMDFGENGELTIPDKHLNRVLEKKKNGEYYEFLVAESLNSFAFRISETGQLDRNSGQNGIIKFTEDFTSSPFSSSMDSAGNYYLARSPLGTKISIQKNFSDGELDTEFGFGGTIAVNLGQWSRLYADIQVVNDKYIYFVGAIRNRPQNSNSKGILFRIDLQDRVFDSDYGTNGFVELKQEGGNFFFVNSIHDAEGNIYVNGSNRLEDGNAYRIVKINNDGELEMDFLNNILDFSDRHFSNNVGVRDIQYLGDKIFYGANQNSSVAPDSVANYRFGFIDLEGNDNENNVEFKETTLGSLDHGKLHVFNDSDTTVLMYIYNNVYLEGHPYLARKATIKSFIKEVINANDEIITDEISIHPNPSNGQVTIENTEAFTHWSVSDIDGRSVKEGTLEYGRNAINVNVEKTGIYFLTLTDSQGKKQSQKIKILK